MTHRNDFPRYFGQWLEDPFKNIGLDSRTRILRDHLNASVAFPSRSDKDRFFRDRIVPRGARIAFSLLESSDRMSRQGTFARFDSHWVWQAATIWRAVCRDVYFASTPILPKGFRSGGAA